MFACIVYCLIAWLVRWWRILGLFGSGEQLNPSSKHCKLQICSASLYIIWQNVYLNLIRLICSVNIYKLMICFCMYVMYVLAPETYPPVVPPWILLKILKSWCAVKSSSWTVKCKFRSLTCFYYDAIDFPSRPYQERNLPRTRHSHSYVEHLANNF